MGERGERGGEERVRDEEDKEREIKRNHSSN
jgi:hypothetical protein